MPRKQRTRTLYRLPAGPQAAAGARRIVARELTDACSADGCAADASLLLGELVAERLDSARPESGLIVEVIRGHRHRWCVVDRGTPTLPEGMRSAALEAFAASWGVSRARGLTHTWFELPMAS